MFRVFFPSEEPSSALISICGLKRKLFRSHKNYMEIFNNTVGLMFYVSKCLSECPVRGKLVRNGAARWRFVRTSTVLLTPLPRSGLNATSPADGASAWNKQHFKSFVPFVCIFPTYQQEYV